MYAPRITHKFPGYKEVCDLIPDGRFLQYTVIWRLSLEFYQDDIDGLKRRLVLELAHDIENSKAAHIVVIMEAPAQIAFPDSWQILGLDFEDIRDRGMEGLKWRAYDYEMSGFEVYCSSVRLERRACNAPSL